MNLLRKLVPFLLALGLASCALTVSGCATIQEQFQIQRSSSAVISKAISDYRRQKDKIDHHVIVGMVSYTSGYVSAKPMSKKQIKKHFDDRIKWMSKNKKVTKNFPISPNTYELRWYSNFVYGWYKYAGWRYSYPNELKQDFQYVASSVIFGIQDYEYKKRGIER